MLTEDLAVKRHKTSEAMAIGRKRKRSKESDNSSSNPSYHFIAFVPSGDHVWALDGLQESPSRLGKSIAVE